MISFLTTHFPVAVEERAGRGRCLVAARDLAPGTVVMANAPAAMLAHHPNRCSYCLGRSREGSAGLQRCSACKCAAYCSRECQRADWGADHKAECKALPALPRALGAAAIARDPGIVDKVVLAGRVLRGRRLAAKVEPAGGDKRVVPAAGSGAGSGADACKHPYYTHTMEDVHALECDPSPTVREECLEVARCGLEVGLFPDVATAQAAGALLTAFDRNNFSIFDALQVSQASAVYPAGALLNHSCAPNCVLTYCTLPPAPPVWHGANGPALADGRHVQVIRAIDHVPAGTELCHSYVEIAAPRCDRRARLREVYGFECSCVSCADATATAYLVAALHTGHHLRAPLPGSDLASSRQRQQSGLKVPGGAQTFAPISVQPDGSPLQQQAGVEAAVGASGVAEPLSPAAIRELVDSAEMMAFSEGAAAMSDAALVLLPAPAALSPREALMIRSAQRNGLSQKEAMHELRRVHLLERALALRRKHLHALHVDVIPIVSALLTQYVLLGDIPSALAACAHLVAFYRFAYAKCRRHPMLGLQLFTLADLRYETASAMGSAGAEFAHSMVRPREALLAELFIEDLGPDVRGVQVSPAASLADKLLLPDDLLASARDAYKECYEILLATAGADDEMTRAAGARYSQLRLTLGNGEIRSSVSATTARP